MLLIFAYAPMYGVILAFKDYKVSLGIWNSPWASNHGLNNFIRIFSELQFQGVPAQHDRAFRLFHVGQYALFDYSGAFLKLRKKCGV